MAASKTTLADLRRMVEEWITILGLTHWQIEVRSDAEATKYFTEDASDAYASTHRKRDYDEADIYFNPEEYPGWNIQKAEETVVHELLHLVTREIEFVMDQLDGMLHRDVDKVIGLTFKHHVEGAIERLARSFVSLRSDAT